MKSFLTYRLPNQEIQVAQGRFELLKDPTHFEGFLISNFEGSHFFGFLVDGEEEKVSEQSLPVTISEHAYIDLAYEFIHHLQDHQIGKAILSRVKATDFDANKRGVLFEALCSKYPNAFCYSFESPTLGTWIGATPETLVSFEENNGKTMSLAGTKPAVETSAWGEKELHEQQMVTDFIFDQLKAETTVITVSDRLELNAGPVKHLVHYFSFQIAVNQRWELIKRLHPTPAVSGFPRAAALDCISRFEPHDRKFYAGIIGVQNPKKTDLFVNLRCAELQNNQLFAYVGGGLTQASVPQDEWVETENKAKTLLEML